MPNLFSIISCNSSNECNSPSWSLNATHVNMSSAIIHSASLLLLQAYNLWLHWLHALSASTNSSITAQCSTVISNIWPKCAPLHHQPPTASNIAWSICLRTICLLTMIWNYGQTVDNTPLYPPHSLHWQLQHAPPLILQLGAWTSWMDRVRITHVHNPNSIPSIKSPLTEYYVDK